MCPMAAAYPHHVGDVILPASAHHWAPVMGKSLVIGSYLIGAEHHFPSITSDSFLFIVLMLVLGSYLSLCVCT